MEWDDMPLDRNGWNDPAFSDFDGEIDPEQFTCPECGALNDEPCADDCPLNEMV